MYFVATLKRTLKMIKTKFYSTQIKFLDSQAQCHMSVITSLEGEVGGSEFGGQSDNIA